MAARVAAEHAGEVVGSSGSSGSSGGQRDGTCHGTRLQGRLSACSSGAEAMKVLEEVGNANGFPSSLGVQFDRESIDTWSDHGMTNWVKLPQPGNWWWSQVVSIGTWQDRGEIVV